MMLDDEPAVTKPLVHICKSCLYLYLIPAGWFQRERIDTGINCYTVVNAHIAFINLAFGVILEKMHEIIANLGARMSYLVRYGRQ